MSTSRRGASQTRDSGESVATASTQPQSTRKRTTSTTPKASTIKEDAKTKVKTDDDVDSSNPDVAAELVDGSPSKNAHVFGSVKTTNVYVSGLGADTTDADLYALGSRYGTVISHRVVMTTHNPLVKICRGYGFLVYPTIEEAEHAIEKLNNNGYSASHAQESLSSKLRRSADPTTSNVYLCNLPRTLNVQQLDQLFAPHHVASRRILIDAEGNSRGVAFVRLEDRFVASECIDRLNGITLPGENVPIQARFADNPDQKLIKNTFKLARNAGVPDVATLSLYNNNNNNNGSSKPAPYFTKPDRSMRPTLQYPQMQPVFSASVGPVMGYPGSVPARSSHTGAFMVLNQISPGMFIAAPGPGSVSPNMSMPSLSPTSVQSSTFSSQDTPSPSSFLHGSTFSPVAFGHDGHDLDKAAQHILSTARGGDAGKNTVPSVGLGIGVNANGHGHAHSPAHTQPDFTQKAPASAKHAEQVYAIPPQTPQYLSLRRAEVKAPLGPNNALGVSLGHKTIFGSDSQSLSTA